MKYHIIVKFTAVMLCALFLLSAAGSGFGILAFTEMELYEKTVDELYNETLTDLAEAFAGQTSTRYAGKTLGGCPETILGGYGIFTEGRYAYNLYDPEGNVVDRVEFDYDVNRDLTARYYRTEITGRQYMKLVSTAPLVESYTIDGITSYSVTGVTNKIPYDGVEVGTVEIALQGTRSPMGYRSSMPLGTLYNNEDGSVRFCSSDTESFFPGEGLVYGIVFYGMDGELLYKAASSNGVGYLTLGEDGYAYFGSYPEDMLNATLPPETVEYDFYQDEYYVYDAVPPGGSEVQEIFVDYLDGNSEGCGSEGGLGLLFYTSEGDIRFNAFSSADFLSQYGPVTHITFRDAQGNLLYEAGSDDGSAVGIVYENDDGILCYEPIRVRGEAIPNTTAPLTEPISEPEATPVTEMPEEVPTEAPAEISAAITDNMKQLGYHVAVVTVYDAQNNSDSIKRDYHFGFLIDNQDGTITFRSLDPMDIPNRIYNITVIEFYDANGQLLYKVQSPNGVGSFSQNTFGMIEFHTTVTPADVEAANAPATTNPATEPETTVPVTEAPEETSTLAPTEEPAETPTETIPTRITDNLDQLGIYVATITVFDEKGYSTGIQRDTAFGYLSRNEDGTVTFRSNKDITLPDNVDTENLNHIAFLDVQGRLLYEIQSPNGVGYFSQEEADRLVFISTVPPADAEAANTPATTAPVTEPETTVPATEEPEETPTLAPTEAPTELATEAPTEAPVADEANIIAEATEPTAYGGGDDLFTIHYWDSELQENVAGRFVYEDLPEGYVLELWLLPGAFELDPLYDLLQFIWQYRAELFYILGISVFLFAVFAVYLCCAAGRKPGREEVRPSGFNRIPLDAYLAAGGFGIYGLALLSIEGSYYLLRNSPHVIAPYVLIAGYIAALVIVGFSFACAAQFKTAGGYWWRNLIFVRAMMLVAKVIAWFEKFLRLKCIPLLVRAVKFCWRNGIKLCKLLYRYTEKFLTWFVKFTVRVAKSLWKYGCIFAVAGFRGFEKALTWLGKGLGKIAQRTHAWLHAFLSLLPVTWQWLLVGFAMLLLMVITANTNNEESLVLLCGAACVAIILYASHCFGILWDSTKRMSKGDLDTKVDDKLMIGAFKDFAGDLNALADVAVVAAQKQTKSERMKTELITNVSHDIKTPLTSIINYVDLLQKPHTDEEQEVYLEVLSRQSQQMKKLLEDLIDMSKASTGNMTVYITPLDTKEALSQVMGEFADKLEAAQLIPVVRQPEADVTMQADGRLVWRVLSNVMSNVVKYALPGTRVYIDLVKADGNVQISVKNISREALNVSADELMERFVRGDASRNTEGSGLGLNIAKSLMDIQKGHLELLVDGDLFKVTLTFPGVNE